MAEPYLETYQDPMVNRELQIKVVDGKFPTQSGFQTGETQ
jgi:hypothetical protein